MKFVSGGGGGGGGGIRPMVKLHASSSHSHTL